MEEQEIIVLLEKLKFWEDEFILKYDSEDFWELLKSLPKSKFDKLRILFEENISDTRYHKKAIEAIIKNIQDGTYGL
ncbi:MAG: hypothetical protein GXP63_02820 [DPANN group archaeon]|nr:hypothetical protein [DPANN group archaeon]